MTSNRGKRPLVSTHWPQPEAKEPKEPSMRITAECPEHKAYEKDNCPVCGTSAKI